MVKVAHNVGHSKYDTAGKQSPDGVKEWAQASEICKLVMAELANYEGVAQKRFDDTTGRVDIPLKQRYTAINNWCADVGIDYHLNAHGNGATWTDGNGVEVFICESKPKEALALAQKLQSNIVAATGFRNRGVKFENWDMVYFTKKTHVLVEMGFMTNRQNTDFIRSAEGQKKIAMAIVNALAAQYRLKRNTHTQLEVAKPQLTNVILRYIYTGGHAYANLQSVHTYLFKAGHGFIPKRGSDGSIIFLVGPYDTGAKNFKDCMTVLGKFDKHIKLLTREQVAEWKE